jgi:hypothetical protein
MIHWCDVFFFVRWILRDICIAGASFVSLRIAAMHNKERFGDSGSVKTGIEHSEQSTFGFQVILPSASASVCIPFRK